MWPLPGGDLSTAIGARSLVVVVVVVVVMLLSTSSLGGKKGVMFMFCFRYETSASAILNVFRR